MASSYLYSKVNIPNFHSNKGSTIPFDDLQYRKTDKKIIHNSFYPMTYSLIYQGQYFIIISSR